MEEHHQWSTEQTRSEAVIVVLHALIFTEKAGVWHLRLQYGLGKAGRQAGRSAFNPRMIDRKRHDRRTWQMPLRMLLC